MPRNNYRTWLENINAPEQGVGDLDDLKVFPSVGENGRWLVSVANGWFYSNKKEQYNYLDKKTFVTVVSSGGGMIDLAAGYNTKWGPVLVDGLHKQYLQHANSFSPGNVASWTSAGSGFYYATIPASSILVGVRDLTQFSLGEVDGLLSLISEKFYYYDRTNSRVYIKSSTATPNVFLDYLYSYVILKFREVVTSTASSFIPSYSDLISLDVSRGSQTQTLSGASTYTHSLTGVSNGDWLVLEYYIPYSYTLRSNTSLRYYTPSASGDTLTISWEGSVPGMMPAAVVTSPSSGILNLNPFDRDSYRAGFLFHSEIDNVPSKWVAHDVLVGADKDEYCPSVGEVIKVSVLVLDEGGLPIPKAPITMTYPSGCTVLYSTPNITGAVTDNRGEFHALFRTPTAMTRFTFAVTSGTATGAVSVTGLTKQQLLPEDVFFDGSVNVIVTTNLTSKGYLSSFVNRSNLDGIPQTTLIDQGINLISSKSSKYDNFNYGNGVLSNGLATLYTSQTPSNISSYLEFGYLPVPGDKMLGYFGKGKSEILEAQN